MDKKFKKTFVGEKFHNQIGVFVFLSYEAVVLSLDKLQNLVNYALWV